MVSLITVSHHFLYSNHPVGHLKFPSISSLVLEINPDRRRRLRRQVSYFNPLLAKKSSSLRFLELKRRSDGGSWCKGWESDGDPALESEILEFMKKSAKPDAFPTKEELVDDGRMDLVEAIRKKGGWLSLGWDSDDDNEEDKLTRNSAGGVQNFGDFERRVASCEESNSFEGAEVGCSGVPSVLVNTSPSASPSGRSLEMAAEEDTGIEGILTRLEKQRNLSFGINLGINVYGTRDLGKDDGDHSPCGSSTDWDTDNLEKNGRSISGSPSRSIYYNDPGGKLSHNGPVSDDNGLASSVNPETWRTWSFLRAGFSDTEFEAAEFSVSENQIEGKREDSKNELLAITKGATEASDRWKEINHNYIQTRLQDMGLELASALHLLRSKREDFISKGHESTSDDLHKLSDAWEFQENELMYAQDRLRSVRAKLAVLEGKMALALIDAQKIVEEKQKRIDSARRALQLLHNVSIVWPNPGSEVLLSGSFDGWTTQRKMEKSKTGIFSLKMKLYPGRYEFKFIVDGVWRIDPLRQIVRNNGYENNLLIVHEGTA